MTSETQNAFDGQLRRTIDWKGAFWVASGAPALVPFLVYEIASVSGTAAFAIWAVSMLFGFTQSFAYAEIAGLFPNKSGGTSVHGAAAWIRYCKFIAPLSVWCGWIAWTPLLSLGCAIAAVYILNAVAPIPATNSPDVAAWLADPANAAALAGLSPENAAKTAIQALTPMLRSWTLLDLRIEKFAAVSISATQAIGAVLMLIILAIQHYGIRAAARIQMLIGLIVLFTLVAVGVLPLIQGKVATANFAPFVPDFEKWELAGWAPILGGMFIAVRWTAAFETAASHTRELQNPATDTLKAIRYAGLLCIAVFILMPFTFQAALGVMGMTNPDLAAGTGVAVAMARMVGDGPMLETILVIVMVLALLLAAMTAIEGSSRTLYQGSVDGWLPHYLSQVNRHGAPARAMWTNFGVNLVILTLIASDIGNHSFILVFSSCGYLMFSFLSLHAAWIHRIDSGHIRRAYRAPTFLLALGAIVAFLNAALLGSGAAVWNLIPDTILDPRWGVPIVIAAIVPIFWFRHYAQDGGKFPARMMEDLGLREGEGLGEPKAGMLPYLTLAGGVAVVILSAWFFHQ